MIPHFFAVCFTLATTAQPRPDSAAITSMLALAYPGSRIIFSRDYRDTLIDNTGRREEVQLRFDRGSIVHVGALVVTFRARRDSAIARAERGVPHPGRSSSELFVADLSPTDVASKLRRATLDDVAVGTTLDDVKISFDEPLAGAAANDTGDVAVVVAQYTATYTGKKWVGGVQWRGLFQIKPTTLAGQQRYPEMFVKMAPGDTIPRVHGSLRVFDDAVPTEPTITLTADVEKAGVQSKKNITLPWSDTIPLSGVLLLNKF
jgi:hypothetical protein